MLKADIHETDEDAYINAGSGIMDFVPTLDVVKPDVFVVTNVSMFAFGADVWMAYDATNYAFYVECDWVPTPSIVTNGSYHVRAVGTGERAVPIGVKIKMVNRHTGETREVR